MKTVIIIAIAFVLLIPISVYAEEFLVGLPEQRVTPDCVSRDECFVPSYLRIDVGDTVTWKMVDPNWATITSGTPETGSDGNFESSQLRHYPNRNSYSYTFEESGIFHYYDKDFPHARGVIVVGDAQFPNPYQKKVVNVQTTQGNFVIQLFEDYAPLSTKNFLELVEKEEYDHTLFSFNSYSIMGGDANTKLDDRENWGWGDKSRKSTGQQSYSKHDLLEIQKYVVTNGYGWNITFFSQNFVIHLKDHSDWTNFDVFGIVIDGREVIDRIGEIQTETDYFPINPEDARILKMSIELESNYADKLIDSRILLKDLDFGEIEKEVEIESAPVEQPKLEQMMCTLQWDPMCGVDGETYGNLCMLDAAGAIFDYGGECVGTEPELKRKSICGDGTIDVDGICQVAPTEEKQVEKSVDTTVEKPAKKSVNWFSSLFDWLGSLFR